MTKREKRVIAAFLNCVKSGEYSLDYAIILIEDSQRFGWLSETAKNAFYESVPDTDGEEETANEDDMQMQLAL